MHTIRTLLVLAVAAAQAAADQTVPRAEESLPLQQLAPLVLALGSKDCAILCPDDAALRGAAVKLADTIRAKTGRRPRIARDTAAPETLGRGPLLVLGNLVLSAAGKKLYFTGYDFTDYAWPGKGGHVVRTIRDPFGTGAHVLMIGGSYPEDVAGAAGRAAEIVAERGPNLGYINDVKLGKHADVIGGWTSALLKKDVKWSSKGVSVQWAYQQQIGKAGMGYLRTGDEAYLRVYKKELLYLLDWALPEAKTNRWLPMHSLIDTYLLPWDLFADHPLFSAEERRQIDEKFLLLACSQQAARALHAERRGPKNNHELGRAMDAYWLARYFKRRYRIPEADAWLSIVDRFFGHQMLSSKPKEDRIFYAYRCSLLCTLLYALATDNREYLGGRALREATDRAIMECSVGHPPMTYLGARAVAAGDPTYLTLMSHAGGDAYIKYCAGMRGAVILGEHLRSFCGFTTPQEKKELLGAVVAPLDPSWGRRKAHPPGAFDKLVIRDSYAPDSFWLKMDGIYGGDHSFPDANCIVSHQERGVLWLGVEYEYRGPTASTVRQHNGVFAARNGQGPAVPQRFARLLYVDKLGDTLDVAGGALDGYGDVGWERHLLRSKDAWTFVLDRVLAAKPGELLVARHWHLKQRYGKRAREYVRAKGGVVCREGPLALHLESVGVPPDGVSGTAHRAETVRLMTRAGSPVQMASLLYVDDQPDAARYALAQTAKGWRITDRQQNRTLGLALRDGRLALSPAAAGASVVPPPKTLPLTLRPPRTTLPWQRVRVGEEITAVAIQEERIAAATKSGLIVVVARNGANRRQVKVAGHVHALHFLGGDLLVGQENGTISRFDELGREMWSVTIPYVRSKADKWNERTSRIREITAADMDGDGTPEILLSNGDGYLYAFTATGEQIWKKEARRGVNIALTPTTISGQFALFGGASGTTLLAWANAYNRWGKVMVQLSGPTAHGQQLRDLRLFDLDNDGEREIIAAFDAPAGQIFVYPEGTSKNWRRDLVWKADVGGSPDALAIRRYRGTTQILCGSRGRYLHALNGADGKQQWFCWLGDEPRMLWPRADGTVLAVCPSGNVLVVSADGRLLGRDELGAEITALLRPGEHRVAPGALLIGTRDGVLHIL